MKTFVSSWCQVDLIWFDSLWFDDAPRRKKLKLKLHIAAAIESNQANETSAGGLPDSMSYHCLGEVASGATGCLARLSPDLTSLAFLLIRYMLGISEVCQPMEQRALYITLCCCVEYVYLCGWNQKSFNQLPGACGMRTVIRLSGRQCSLLLLR